MELRLIGQFSASVFPEFRDLLQEAGIRVFVEDAEDLDLRGVRIPVVKLLVREADFEKARELIIRG